MTGANSIERSIRSATFLQRLVAGQLTATVGGRYADGTGLRNSTDAAVDDDYDGLDEASNRVIDLIHAGRLDEAEQDAKELLKKYPQVHDGLERLAMVYAARGDRPRAAEYYRKAADFVHDRADQYDPDMEMYLRKKVTESESQEA